MTHIEALQLIATPMRPDGTWNRDREACRKIAADALASTTDPTAALKLARDALALFTGENNKHTDRERLDIARAALAAIDALPAPSGEPAEPLQAGMHNAELVAAWRKKLPGVEPTDRELSAFAVGTEVGWHRAREVEKLDWSRVHHVLAKHGKHPGRTDDHLADVIDRALTTQAAPAPQAIGEPAVPTRADLIAALQFYAAGNHRITVDESAWDTVSGEPSHWLGNEAGDMVEDGTIAAEVLAGALTAQDLADEDDDDRAATAQAAPAPQAPQAPQPK